MAVLVRDAAMRDQGLCDFAAGLLIKAGLDSHSSTSEILDCVFRYVQGVKYIADPGGNFDAISSARDTLQKQPQPYGDCDDLSVLLASLLACLGFEPSFVLAKYDETASGFDHVYVSVTDKNGAEITLDPTSRRHGIGWESPKFIDRVTFPIFGGAGAMNALSGQVYSTLGAIQCGLDGCKITAQQAADAVKRTMTTAYSGGRLNGILDDLVNLIPQGVQIGTQYAASSAQRSKATAAQMQQANAQFDAMAGQVAAYYQRLAAKGQAITADDYNSAVRTYQSIEQFVAQYATPYITAQWNSANYKQAALNYLAQFQGALVAQGQPVVMPVTGLVSSPTVSQIGANGAAVGATSDVSGSGGLSNAPVPTALLLGGAVLLAVIIFRR